MIRNFIPLVALGLLVSCNDMNKESNEDSEMETTATDSVTTQPEEEITDFITQLEEESTSLENTIPERLLTEEVMEDIKDIREEVADLRRVTEQPGVDESKIGNQVEELVEAYQDLNEELKETMTKKGSTLLDDNQ